MTMIGFGTIVSITPSEGWAPSGAITPTYGFAVSQWTGTPGRQIGQRPTLGRGQLGFGQESGSDYASAIMPMWALTTQLCYSRESSEALVACALPFVAETNPSAGAYARTYSLYSGSGAISTPYLSMVAKRGQTGQYDGVRGGYIQSLSLDIRPGEAAVLEVRGSAYRVERDHTPASAPTLPSGADDCVLGYQAAAVTWAGGDAGPYSISVESARLDLATGLAGRRSIHDLAPSEPSHQAAAAASVTITVSDDVYMDLFASGVADFDAGIACNPGDLVITLTSSVTIAHDITITLQDAVITQWSDPITTRGALVRTLTFESRASPSKSGLTIRFRNGNSGPY